MPGNCSFSTTPPPPPSPPKILGTCIVQCICCARLELVCPFLYFAPLICILFNYCKVSRLYMHKIVCVRIALSKRDLEPWQIIVFCTHSYYNSPSKHVGRWVMRSHDQCGLKFKSLKQRFRAVWICACICKKTCRDVSLRDLMQLIFVMTLMSDLMHWEIKRIFIIYLIVGS